ncbi:MAG TPA: hypothetical protein VHB79_30035 [Polyangiaceae bacterium]|nr:hypothetical protein [Polyangiaceae bacterium]
MSSSDSHDRSSRSSTPPLSEDAITPRGGFMARPGLKSPPRHAVVVRVGDAPTTDNIPVARPSVPPPPPSEPAAESSSEKITARAIPRPSTPAPPAVAEVAALDAEAARRAREHKLTIPSSVPGELARGHALESAPPPSDAPLVSSLRDREALGSRRARSSLWPIVAAAAAGLVLGLATVATRMHGNQVVAPAAMATLEPAPVAAARPALAAAMPPANPASAPSTSASPTLKDHAVPPSRPLSASPGAKRSIF